MKIAAESQRSTLEFLNPLEHEQWNHWVVSHPDSSFFHSSNWARVLSESYGYQPRYLTGLQGNEASFMLPLMEVKSVLTGKRGVSLPFTDYCQPLVSDKKLFDQALEELIGFGKKAGWSYIELRDGRNFPVHLVPSRHFFGHTLDLSTDEDKMFNTFQSSTRRNIRKAVRENVSISFHDSIESVKQYYSLNGLLRKRHGLPSQPMHFFQKIHEHVLTKGRGFVILASHEGETIAGAIFFGLGNRAIYKYGASDMACQNLRANDLVLWEAMKRFARRGFKTFCFGRTDPENKGLRRFKAGFGTRERIIRYYKYDLKKEGFVRDSPMLSEFQGRIFRRMPIPVLNMIGSILYRHVG